MLASGTQPHHLMTGRAIVVARHAAHDGDQLDRRADGCGRGPLAGERWRVGGEHLEFDVAEE